MFIGGMEDPHRLTLRGLEVFVAVVEAGALGEGARRLGAAASTVSQQITNLEHALGVALIDRKARPFALTAAGRLFHARALAVIDQIAQARAELSELDLSAVRELNLSLLEDFEADVLPELLIRLARTFPNCNFIARTGYSHENLAALEGRSADLVLSAEIEDVP
ncbi:MAG: LysR family transcriptional regulator, partial [Pseudomonadota bacterium]